MTALPNLAGIAVIESVHLPDGDVLMTGDLGARRRAAELASSNRWGERNRWPRITVTRETS